MKTVHFLLFLEALTGAATGLFKKRYIPVPIKKNWNDAQTYCRTNYVDLSTINSLDEENNFYNSNPFCNTYGCWIGLKKENYTTTFIRWSDGAGFNNWKSWGDFTQTSKFCVAIWNRQWYWWDCTDMRTFVCYIWEPQPTVAQEMKTWDEALRGAATGLFKRRYIYIPEAKTWNDAQKYCRTNYVDLLTINSQDEENNFYYSFPDHDSGCYYYYCWIGLKKENYTTTFIRWSDGTVFKNWKPWGDFTQTSKFCVAIWNRQWYWGDCTDMRTFVCYIWEPQPIVVQEMSIWAEALTEAATGLFKRIYIYVPEAKTWNDAQTYCRRNYVDLSTINSQVEQNNFYNSFPFYYSGYYWIGLKKEMGSNATVQWSDGVKLKHQIYFEEYWNTSELCLTTHRKWWDCNFRRTFVCYTWVPQPILIQEMRTWDEALAHCRTFYTDLISLTSENDLFLTNNMITHAGNFWTGLHFLDGSWFWVNREPLGSLVSLPSCPARPFLCGAKTGADVFENRDCEEKMMFMCY